MIEAVTFVSQRGICHGECLMRTFESDDGFVVIRLDKGDLVLESIEAACEQHDVDTGAVVSGIGTLSHLHVHYLHTADLEAERSDRNTFFEDDGCWEISAIQGMIADGTPHLHVTAWDGETSVAGHLEEGNVINALGEILIRKIDGLKLTRRPDQYNVSMLEER